MAGTKAELSRSTAANEGAEQEEIGHPKGTLAIVAIFGGLMLFGWLAMYVFVFLQRGA